MRFLFAILAVQFTVSAEVYLRRSARGAYMTPSSYSSSSQFDRSYGSSNFYNPYQNWNHQGSNNYWNNDYQWRQQQPSQYQNYGRPQPFGYSPYGRPVQFQPQFSGSSYSRPQLQSSIDKPFQPSSPIDDIYTTTIQPMTENLALFGGSDPIPPPSPTPPPPPPPPTDDEMTRVDAAQKENEVRKVRGEIPPGPPGINIDSIVETSATTAGSLPPQAAIPDIPLPPSRI